MTNTETLISFTTPLKFGDTAQLEDFLLHQFRAEIEKTQYHSTIDSQKITDNVLMVFAPNEVELYRFEPSIDKRIMQYNIAQNILREIPFEKRVSEIALVDADIEIYNEDYEDSKDKLQYEEIVYQAISVGNQLKKMYGKPLFAILHLDEPNKHYHLHAIIKH